MYAFVETVNKVSDSFLSNGSGTRVYFFEDKDSAVKCFDKYFKDWKEDLDDDGEKYGIDVEDEHSVEFQFDEDSNYGYIELYVKEMADGDYIELDY